jgi:hypothetical protein
VTASKLDSSTNNERKKFKIQYCSDLHLEFGTKPIIKPEAPYLALLGDIGLSRQAKYHDFLLEQAKHFEKVFVILGTE